MMPSTTGWASGATWSLLMIGVSLGIFALLAGDGRSRRSPATSRHGALAAPVDDAIDAKLDGDLRRGRHVLRIPKDRGPRRRLVDQEGLAGKVELVAPRFRLGKCLKRVPAVSLQVVELRRRGRDQHEQT